jgi:hypothetical protein
MKKHADQPSIAAWEPAAFFLSELLLGIHQQEHLPGILRAVSEAGRRNGVPCATGYLTPEAGDGTWRIAALTDPAGDPLVPSEMGLPMGGFAFAPPPFGIALPMEAMLANVWGSAGVERLQQYFGTQTVLFAPVEGDSGPRGLLVALLSATDGGSLMPCVLTHAATAARACLAPGGRRHEGEMVAGRELIERAEHEIARADRYGREITLVAFESQNLDDLAEFGQELVGTVRRWDVVGRLDTGTPTLVAVLPETNRSGGQGLVKRLGIAGRAFRTGVATFPADGRDFTTLLDSAFDRQAPAPIPITSSATPADGSVWRRWAMPGANADVVRCPGCRVSYSRPQPVDATPATLDHQRTIARAALQSECPRHQPQLAAAG